MKQSRYTYCTDVTSEQPSMYPTEGEQAGDIRWERTDVGWVEGTYV